MAKYKNKKMPRRTSSKEAYDRDKSINVMAILADRHPNTVEDYAIHLYYLSNNHNPFFKVNDKRTINNELAELIIDNKWIAKVNIYTGVINKIPIQD